MTVQTTYRSVILNLAYYLVDYATGDAPFVSKWGVATYTMSKCSGSLNLQSGTLLNPRDALSSATFTNVVSCLANQVFSSFSDPKTALGAARELNDPAISHMDSAQWATQVESIAGKLRAFGVLLALRPLLQQGWQGSADVLGSLHQRWQHPNHRRAGRRAPQQRRRRQPRRR